MTQPKSDSGHLADTIGEPTYQAQKHSPLPWLIREHSPATVEQYNEAEDFYHTIALCDDSYTLNDAEMEANAALIVEAVNSHATLVERVAKLEEVIADLCRAIEDYAPEDNVALNQAWFLAVEAAKP